MPWIAILIAFVAGAVTPVQAGLNSTLRGRLGHPMHATFVNFAVGTLIAGFIMALLRVPVPGLAAMRGAPWWAWLGGACGVTLVGGSILAVRDLGYAGLVVGIVCGQVVLSLALDQLGLFGHPVREISPVRLLGAAMVLGGVLIIQFTGAPSKPAAKVEQGAVENGAGGASGANAAAETVS